MGYCVIAEFYLSAERQPCRRKLDIKLKSCAASHPQLIVLMLNPGSCGGIEELLEAKDVQVKPDPTLHRIIKVMRNQQIEWIRVLNISDVREKDSKRFFALYCSCPGELPVHSIFHPSRKQELRSLIPPQAPFVIAWGMDKRKDSYADKILTVLIERGHPVINKGHQFIHPLARPSQTVPVWTKLICSLYSDFIGNAKNIS